MNLYAAFTIFTLLFMPVTVTGGTMQVEVTILENPEENQITNNNGGPEQNGSLNTNGASMQIGADEINIQKDRVNIEDEKAPTFKNFIKNTIWFLTGDKNHTPINDNILFIASVGMLLIILLILLLILLIAIDIVYRRAKRTEKEE